MAALGAACEATLCSDFEPWNNEHLSIQFEMWRAQIASVVEYKGFEIFQTTVVIERRQH